MTRKRIIWTIVLPIGALLLLLLIGRIASLTYWGEESIALPPKGEAASNPFYAAEHLVEALGGHATRDRNLGALPLNGVVVISGWHWSLSTTRRDRLERWVESGGRLVVDRTLVGDEEEFEHWSGVGRIEHTRDSHEEADSRKTRQQTPTGPTLLETPPPCRKLIAETAYAAGREAPYEVCLLDAASSLTSVARIDWAVRDRRGIGALRVSVGRGSVSVVNAWSPFSYRWLFLGDHGRLLVALMQLHRGDLVHFLSEDEHGSLVSLLWQAAAPMVALLLAVLALILWRRGVRFGPVAPPPERARRSLAEQIVGTGEFLLRVDGSTPLYAAELRALTEAARRRVPGYAQLSSAEQAATLVRLTGLPARALSSAIEYRGVRRRHELYGDIALIEAARRRISPSTKGSLHGNRVDHDNARG